MLNTQERLERAGKVEALVHAFPSLFSADPPLYPLESDRLTAWAGQYDKIREPMAYWAARFVLSVCLDGWAGFDAVQAVRAWDPAHREVFIRWVRRPFFGGVKARTARARLSTPRPRTRTRSTSPRKPSP